MKKNYITVLLIFTCFLMKAQNDYEFGIVHVSGYEFKVVAIPNFNSSGNTDVSDVSFTLALPAGNFDMTNVVSSFSGRTATVQERNAAVLQAIGGDGTLDFFECRYSPGSTIITHSSGDHIDLITFEITNSPTSGEIRFVANNDPIDNAAGDIFESSYNSNIDGTTTQDYFSGFASGLDSFSFSTMSNEELIMTDLKIYPNPTTDKLFITTNTPLESLILYDVLGKPVLKKTNTSEVNMMSLPNGVYFLQLRSTNAQITRKIIKE